MKLIKLFFAFAIVGLSFDAFGMLSSLRRTAVQGKALLGAPRIVPTVGSVLRTKAILGLPPHNQKKEKSEQSARKESAWKKNAKYALIGISAGIVASKLTRKNTASSSDQASLAKSEAEKYIKEMFTYKAPWAKQRQLHRERLLNTPWKTVSKEYLDLLDQQAQELDREFLALVQLKHDEYELCKKAIAQSEIMQKIEDRGSAACTPLQGPYADHISALMQAFSFDENLKLFRMIGKKKANSPLSTSSHNLFVDVELCNRTMKDVKVLDASLVHEFVHLMEDDSFEGLAQRILLKQKDIDMSVAQAYQIKRKLFQEKRADLLSGLVSPDYALALTKAMHNVGNPAWQKKVLALAEHGRWLDFDKTPNSHPKFSERAAYLGELHGKMIAATDKKA